MNCHLIRAGALMLAGLATGVGDGSRPRAEHAFFPERQNHVVAHMAAIGRRKDPGQPAEQGAKLV